MKKLKNYYFILRHGETIYQAKKRKINYPWPESVPIKLTKKGERQIKKLAKLLKNPAGKPSASYGAGKKIDLIYSSDIFRACQTAEIVVQELGTKINFDKRLRDINLGVYHGRPKKEFYQDFPEPKARFSKEPKKGESWNDVKKRMVNFLKDVEKKQKGKIILIVSHGDPLWLLEGIVKELTNEEMLKERFKNGTIKVAELRKLNFN